MGAYPSIADACTTLVAAAPAALSLVLLLGFRRPGWQAGGLAWALAALLAALAIQDPPAWARPVVAFGLRSGRWWDANLRGALLSLVVLYVLWFGLLLYNLLRRAGAIDAIASRIAGATADPARQALLVVGGLSPFFESVSGFGLGVVIVAPLLLRLGFGRDRATVLGLLGQNAVPWGAMAVGTLIGGELTGLGATRMGTGSAYLNAPLALLYNVLAVAIAAGPAMVVRRVPDILVASAALAGSVWAFSAYVSVELAGVLGGLCAAGATLACARWAEGGSESPATAAAPCESGVARALPPFGRALLPYAVLIAGLLVSRLWPAVSGWLQAHAVLEAPSLAFRLPLAYSPAFYLLLACAAAIPALGLHRPDVGDAARSTWRQWWPAAAATTAFIALSTVMFDAGMTPRLAAWAAAAVGPAFAWVSPFVGGLGGLMTGSNTGANAMLIRFQTETAERAGLPPDVLAYVNNTAAANATMASPGRVALAAAVTGQPEREGHILRRLLPAVALAMAAIAVHARFWIALR